MVNIIIIIKTWVLSFCERDMHMLLNFHINIKFKYLIKMLIIQEIYKMIIYSKKDVFCMFYRYYKYNNERYKWLWM